MTQNPFAHPAEYPGAGEQMPLPARTSVTGILSLVSSLICCIPGLGLIGLVLGIASLLFIAGSHGRLSGKGMAWTGIILGALITALQVGGVIGISAVCNNMLAQTSSILTAVEKGDYAKARAEMGSAAASISDAEFDAFKAAYQAELGSSKTVPHTGMEWWRSFVRAGPQFQGQKPTPGAIPIPVEFDKGTALVFLQQAPGTPPPQGRMVPLGNLHILTATGKEFWLTGPNAAKPAAPSPAPAPGGPPGGNGG